MVKKALNYMPDLSKISLNDFKRELINGRLLPSRKPLLEDIDRKFSKIEKVGVNNAEKLKKILNSAGLKKIAKETNISEGYFKLLKREVNNLLPTPVKFSDIPSISQKIVKKLDSLNIIDTEVLFPYVADVGSRKKFIKASGLSEEEARWLTKIVDVSRIKWVGPKLARLIVDTKYDSVKKLAKANPVDVLNALNDAKKKYRAYDGPLGINDIDSWIRQVVSNTPLIIEY